MAENFKPGSTAKLGIDYPNVKKVNPNVVYSAVSGYGHNGPWGTEPATDVMAQATSGLMSLNGCKEDGMPLKVGASFSDIYSSVQSAAALLAAIIYKLRTGKGGFCDTSMQGTCLPLTGYAIAKYLKTGEITRGTGNRDAEEAFHGAVPANDGKVMVDARTNEKFAAFVNALGLPELIKDERFKDSDSRLANIDELEKIIFPKTEGLTMAEVTKLCLDAGVPCGEICSQERSLRAGQFEAQRMYALVHDKKVGNWKAMACPLHFDKFDTPHDCFVDHPGDHSIIVLKNILGMTDEEIKELYNYPETGVFEKNQNPYPGKELYWPNEPLKIRKVFEDVDRPLAGLRVLELAQEFSGPYCAQILGDFGAEVIKVEPPGGERSRKLGPKYGKTSIFYVHTNRGKRSIELDINNPGHRKILLKLAEKVDIVVEDFKPGAADQLGIGYKNIRKINPDIIYVAITPFGQEGPYWDREGSELIVQALSGLMGITGPFDGEFTKSGAPLADALAGVYAAIGAMVGYIHRERGRGSLYVDIGKLNCLWVSQLDSLTKYINTGEINRPLGNSHRAIVPCYAVPCKDGFVQFNIGKESDFMKFCDLVGAKHLLEDPRFKDQKTRLAHRGEIEKEISEITSKMTMQELRDLCVKNRLQGVPILSVDGVVANEQVKFKEYIITVHDKVEGDFKVVGSPYRYNTHGTLFEVPKSDFVAQPGEHTKEVLKNLLNMKEEEIKALKQN